MLSDGAESLMLLYDKTNRAMKFDGKVKFENTEVVDGTNASLIKYKDVNSCTFN